MSTLIKFQGKVRFEGKTVIEIIPWLLKTGFWNDQGIWDDFSLWND